MFSRREICLSLGVQALSSTLPKPSMAQSNASSLDDTQLNFNAEAPPEFGQADFADAWSPVGDTVAPVAAGPDVPADYIRRFSAISLHSAGDIADHFKQMTGTSFVVWFNQYVAKRGSWLQRDISARQAESHFNLFWDAYLLNEPQTMLTFLAYMTVFLNECNHGDLISHGEIFGYAPDYPGISYLFDTVELPYVGTNRTWRKASYNKSNKNRCAGDLFNDLNFINAHGHLGGAGYFRNTIDDIWCSDHFPIETVDTHADNPTNAFLIEADFYKFRGRGLIQTTWRTNYRKLVAAIAAYEGDKPILLAYKRRWHGLSEDYVCTTSRNSDWDTLFSETEFLRLATQQHASDGHYLPLSDDPSTFNGSGFGSLERMGVSIGGRSYLGVYRRRMYEMCNQILL